jgi:tyrosine decarboxylase/aspartate 1-decarboxylase
MSLKDSGTGYEIIMEELKSANKRDHHFAAGRVLGSMCTQPLDIAKVAHTMFLEANLGNPGLYPGTAEVEAELMNMVADLLHGPNESGLTVSGGTEANITALWIARKVSGGSQVIYPRSAHFSFLKAADILGLEGIEVGLLDDFTLDISQVEDNLNDDTAAVVGIAGTTEYGAIDPIEDLGKLCGDTFLHVDAAFGGFVIPFLKDLGYDTPNYDFEVENVDCVSCDPHKMGLASIPSGVMLLKNDEYLKKIAVSSPYLTSPRQASLSGTRCSAGAVSAWAAMKFLGRDGYRNVVADCMDTTQYIVKMVEEMGLEIALKPPMNIVCIRMKDADSVFSGLSKMGWKASVTREPQCLRIVVMPHVTKEVVDEFVPDLKKVCKDLKEI